LTVAVYMDVFTGTVPLPCSRCRELALPIVTGSRGCSQYEPVAWQFP